MDIADQYFHWLWGDNQLRPDKPNYLINLEHGIIIRFDYELAMFAGYDEFVNHISQINWLPGYNHDEESKEFLITEAWNYLCFEERQLEEDNLVR